MCRRSCSCRQRGGGSQFITPVPEQRLQARAALLDRLLVPTERLGQRTTSATTRLDATEQLAVGRRQLDTFCLQSRSPVADVFHEAFDVIELTPENEAARSTMRVGQPAANDDRAPCNGIRDYGACAAGDHEGEHRLLDGIVDGIPGAPCGEAAFQLRAQRTPRIGTRPCVGAMRGRSRRVRVAHAVLLLPHGKEQHDANRAMSRADDSGGWHDLAPQEGPHRSANSGRKSSRDPTDMLGRRDHRRRSIHTGDGRRTG